MQVLVLFLFLAAIYSSGYASACTAFDASAGEIPASEPITANVEITTHMRPSPWLGSSERTKIIVLQADRFRFRSDPQRRGSTSLTIEIHNAERLQMSGYVHNFLNGNTITVWLDVDKTKVLNDERGQYYIGALILAERSTSNNNDRPVWSETHVARVDIPSDQIALLTNP